MCPELVMEAVGWLGRRHQYPSDLILVEQELLAAAGRVAVLAREGRLQLERRELERLPACRLGLVGLLAGLLVGLLADEFPKAVSL